MFVSQEFAYSLEWIEGMALVNYVNTKRHWTESSNDSWLQVADAVLIGGGNNSRFGTSFGLGLRASITREILEEAEAFFRFNNTSAGHEITSLVDKSSIAVLAAKGYNPIYCVNVMCKSLLQLRYQPKNWVGLSTRMIIQEEIPDWLEVYLKGWSHTDEQFLLTLREFLSFYIHLPNVYCFITELDGVPVGAGNIYLDDTVAFLSGSSRLPQFANLGIQEELINARLAFAQQNDCKIAKICVEPGSKANRNADSSGFKLTYIRSRWTNSLI